MEVTARQIETTFNVPYTTANGLLKFLESCSMAQIVREVRKPGKRGRGTLVYNVDTDVVDLFKFQEVASLIADAPPKLEPEPEQVVSIPTDNTTDF